MNPVSLIVRSEDTVVTHVSICMLWFNTIPVIVVNLAS